LTAVGFCSSQNLQEGAKGLEKAQYEPPGFSLAGVLDDLAGALQFLTILPLGPAARFAPRGVLRFFPVAGLVIGALVSAFDALLGLFLPLPVAAALDVALLALISGALHLDGLADTADGLLGHHARQRSLEIMKDSRVGAMGLVAVGLVLVAKTAGLGAISGSRSLVLILVPALARGAMMIAIATLPYVRPAGGTGQAFCETPPRALDLIWLVVPLGLSVFLGWRALVLAAAFGGVTALMIDFYRRRLGGVTGDLLGALGEVVETLLFVALAAGAGR
jgi:adenosylcobinamide-GDP ribazoletransferase